MDYDDARNLATGIAAAASPEVIAEEVERSILHLGYDRLNPRAGRHEWGYVEPAEAARELLEETIDEHIQNVKRLLEEQTPDWADLRLPAPRS
jgi:hypothetical protein